MGWRFDFVKGSVLMQMLYQQDITVVLLVKADVLKALLIDSAAAVCHLHCVRAGLHKHCSPAT